MPSSRYVLLTLLSLTFLTCQNTPEGSQVSLSNHAMDPIERVPGNSAICLWDGTGLREKPGMSASDVFITSIDFGERVTLMGETEINARDGRSYLKVSLSDGNVGWVYSYLLAEGATHGVVTDHLDIYRRADILTRSETSFFERGDLVAIQEIKGKWAKVVGIERKKTGWINDIDHLASDYGSIRMALHYYRAIKDRNWDRRQDKLLAIYEDGHTRSSRLFDLVDARLEEVKPEPVRRKRIQVSEAPAEVYITSSDAKIHSTPALDSVDNVVAKLPKGTICKVLTIGPRIEIEGKSEQWFKVEVEGREGWVSSYFTSAQVAESN